MGHTRGPSPEAPHKQRQSCLSHFSHHRIKDALPGGRSSRKACATPSKAWHLGTSLLGQPLSSVDQPDPETATSFRNTFYDCPGTASGLLFLSRSSRVALAIPAALIPASGCSDVILCGITDPATLWRERHQHTKPSWLPPDTLHSPTCTQCSL